MHVCVPFYHLHKFRVTDRTSSNRSSSIHLFPSPAEGVHGRSGGHGVNIPCLSETTRTSTADACPFELIATTLTLDTHLRQLKAGPVFGKKRCDWSASTGGVLTGRHDRRTETVLPTWRLVCVDIIRKWKYFEKMATFLESCSSCFRIAATFMYLNLRKPCANRRTTTEHVLFAGYRRIWMFFEEWRKCHWNDDSFELFVVRNQLL